MPDVSILLPCYNAASTLEETLNSLAAQSYTNFEVICVDDGSTDDTAAILDAWGGRDTRFVVLKKSHGGIVDAANLGLEFCRAEIIVRMDADDRCHPDRVSL